MSWPGATSSGKRGNLLCIPAQRRADTAGCICCFAHKRSENAALFLLMLICSVLGPRFTARSAFPDTILPFVAVKVPLSHRVSVQTPVNCECTAQGEMKLCRSWSYIPLAYWQKRTAQWYIYDSIKIKPKDKCKIIITTTTTTNKNKMKKSYTRLFKEYLF